MKICDVCKKEAVETLYAGSEKDDIMPLLDLCSDCISKINNEDNLKELVIKVISELPEPTKVNSLVSEPLGHAEHSYE